MTHLLRPQVAHLPTRERALRAMPATPRSVYHRGRFPRGESMHPTPTVLSQNGPNHLGSRVNRPGQRRRPDHS